MFFHLQYIHLFRPFLKYAPASSQLPSHVSPRRICTASASAISKLMRLYKKTYNLRQICNIAVYMVHSACTIHMLNLPDKVAKRDIIHGVKHLEEIAEDWLCARRTLCIISVLARKWNVELPEEASAVLQKSDEKYGTFSTSDVPSPNRSLVAMPPSPPPALANSSDTSSNPEQKYSQPTPPPAREKGQPSPALDPELLSSMAVALAPPSTLQDPISPTPADMGLTLAGPLAGMNSWAMPVSQPLVGYGQTFAPIQVSSISPPSISQIGTRQITPKPSVFVMDDQDWFLKDSVSWQQNFETWGLGQGAPLSDTGVFMFRGLQGSDVMDSSFDSLSNSMAHLDHLPGLD